MGAVPSSSVLDTFLRARYDSPEGQAVAVFASALYTNEVFCHALLAELGIAGGDLYSVRTEVRTGSELDRIDLELKVLSRAGGLRRRVWIEAKVEAGLSKEIHGESGEVRREAQLIRYRSALQTWDAQRPELDPSLLVLLIPGQPTGEDQRQAEASDARILGWERVAEIAAESAITVVGSGWRSLARSANATLELANLEVLVWFLEAADRATPYGRRPFVGINPVDEPVTPEILNVWRLAPEAMIAIEGLGYAITALLSDAGWGVEEVDVDEPEDEEVGIVDGSAARPDDADLVYDLKPPSEAWWSAAGSGRLWLRPFETVPASPSEEPVIQVGVEFSDGSGPIPSPEWLARLEQLGILVQEFEDIPNLGNFYMQSPLASICAQTSASAQAKQLAGWIEQAFSAFASIQPA